MKKHILLIHIVTILITVGLSGCNSTEQKPDDLFIGKWYYNYEESVMTVIFYDNGSICIQAGEMSVWSRYVLNENYIIVMNPEGNTSSSEYSFSENNQILTLTTTEGVVTVLTRQ